MPTYWEPWPGKIKATGTFKDMIWIQDLERDGYISAKFRMGLTNVPNMIWDVHVLDKGRHLIDDFDSQRTARGIWKRYHMGILTWAITVLTAILIGYLLSRWNLK